MSLGERIVETARTWLGTPFRHAAGVRGHGADCGYFVLRVYQAVGVLPPGDPPPYPPQWFCRRDGHLFEPWVLPAFLPVDDAEAAPGDLVLFAIARARFGHAAIVTAWPAVLHAHPDRGVIADVATAGDLLSRQHPLLARGPRACWRPRLALEAAA